MEWAWVAWCYCRYVLGVLRGKVWRRLGRHARALEVFRRLERFAPGEPVPKLGVAWMLLELGRRDEAVEALARGMGVSGFEASLCLGERLLDVGRSDEAIAYLREAVRLQPREAYGWHQLGRALVLSLLQGEVRDLKRLRWHPWEEGALRQSEALRRVGWEEAAGVWRRVGQLDDEDWDWAASLGLCLEHLGRAEEAMASYREALRRDPEDRQAVTGLDRLGGRAAAAGA